jgi:hypothetical protein
MATADPDEWLDECCGSDALAAAGNILASLPVRSLPIEPSCCWCISAPNTLESLASLHRLKGMLELVGTCWTCTTCRNFVREDIRSKLKKMSNKKRKMSLLYVKSFH